MQHSIKGLFWEVALFVKEQGRVCCLACHEFMLYPVPGWRALCCSVLGYGFTNYVHCLSRRAQRAAPHIEEAGWISEKKGRTFSLLVAIILKGLLRVMSGICSVGSGVEAVDALGCLLVCCYTKTTTPPRTKPPQCPVLGCLWFHVRLKQPHNPWL